MITVCMVAILISYLIGSISSSILVGKRLSEIDIREKGSGNAGATNTLRVLGKKAALLVVACDILKTCVAMILAKMIVPNENIAVYCAGIGVALGHNFPLYFNFKGGKGVLVSIVSVFFADPKIALIVLIVALLIMILSKYVSLGSVLGALLFLILALIYKHSDIFFVGYAVFISFLIIIRHKANIKRLISGTENKLSFGK